ncbi:MAG: TIGR04013 family B12-binding domain/radical SAM domain-containing protein [Methanospirillum sp.]
MRVNFRRSPGTANTEAALAATLEQDGRALHGTGRPTDDVTCYSLNVANVSDLIPEMDRAGCITIAGGPQATACWKEIACAADYVVVSEGERTLPRLLEAIESGSAAPIPGTATAAGGLVPVDHAVRLDAYPPFSRRKGYIECSRGCPHTCAYCQTPRLFPGGMRHRSIDACVEAARALPDVRFVTPNAFAYGSDGLTPRYDKVRRLLAALAREDATIWFGTFPSEVRPEFVTDEALELVRTYCANTRIHFGIQSGSDRVLEALGRGHTVADGLAAADRVLDHGFVPVVDVILGFPFETGDEQEATLALAEYLARRGCRIHAHRFTPLPGTPLASQPSLPLVPTARQRVGRLALAGKLTGSLSDLG